MPQTRQYVLGERPAKRLVWLEGVAVTQDKMQKLLAAYKEKN